MAVEVRKIQELNGAIESFTACYEPLSGHAPHGDVPVETMINFLIDHPELAIIASEIDKLRKEI